MLISAFINMHCFSRRRWYDPKFVSVIQEILYNGIDYLNQ